MNKFVIVICKVGSQNAPSTDYAESSSLCPIWSAVYLSLDTGNFANVFRMLLCAQQRFR